MGKHTSCLLTHDRLQLAIKQYIMSVNVFEIYTHAETSLPLITCADMVELNSYPLSQERKYKQQMCQVLPDWFPVHFHPCVLTQWNWTVWKSETHIVQRLAWEDFRKIVLGIAIGVTWGWMTAVKQNQSHLSPHALCVTLNHRPKLDVLIFK